MATMARNNMTAHRNKHVVHLGLAALLGFLFSLPFAGCERTGACHVPIGDVGFTIQPNDAMYSDLSCVGGSCLLRYGPYGQYVGHVGVIIVRTGLDDFVAYEATCPLDTNTALQISDSLGSAVIECPRCGSLFSTYTDGVPLAGSATSCSLFSYQTIYNGKDLTIY